MDELRLLKGESVHAAIQRLERLLETEQDPERRRALQERLAQLVDIAAW